MPREFSFNKPFRPAFKPKRPHRTGPAKPAGRSDAPGDPVLEVPALTQAEPFRFDAAFAARLRRREVNEKEAFTARDATGAFWRASVKELAHDGGLAVPYERMAASPESAIELTLAVSVLGRQRMLVVAQKATELGVARIVPLLTDHSVPAAGLEHEKAHAWPGQVLRAAKQCRRSSLPELLAPQTWDAFLASDALAKAELAVCLDDVGGGEVAAGGAPKRVVLIVGPEGGFSDAERAKLAGRARSWRLGGRVLRAETAVFVGLAAVHLNWGDFRTA